jgi:hypothetical protein
MEVEPIQTYNTGCPIGVTSNSPLPIFNGANRPVVTTYDWRAPVSGDSFDPAKDKHLNAAAFPAQPSECWGMLRARTRRCGCSRA